MAAGTCEKTLFLPVARRKAPLRGHMARWRCREGGETQLASLRSFAAERWRGEAPLETVFWRDMIMVGTLINVLAAALSMALFAAGAPGGIALLVFFAPVPWNLFLFMAVWRAAERRAGEGGWVFQAAAVVWLVVVTLL